MLTHFIHRGDVIPTDNWRKLQFFYSPQYLAMVMQERDFDGTYSVTQCLDCPRAVIFKLLLPFAVSPEDFAFMILGTKSHAVLENTDTEEKNEYVEVPLTYNLGKTKIKGTLDYAFKHNDEWILVDHKTWGSYAVVKNFGIVSKQIPMVDSEGNKVLYSTSRAGKFKKGDQKKETIFEFDESQADDHDVRMQTNMYRVMLEQYLQQKVKHIRVYVIVRDGGLQVATSRGVFHKTYAKEIRIEPDEVPIQYYTQKTTYLSAEMDRLSFSNPTDIISDPPVIGNEREIFGGWKCEKSCPVAMYCVRCKNHPRRAEYSMLVDNPAIYNTFLKDINV